MTTPNESFSPVLPALRPDTDDWVGVVAHVAGLARSLADTDFVPQNMRGRPAAVAAAILTARELGIGPMTGLAHLHVVKGHVGMSAQLMRQLILAAGHDLRYVETTDTRCVVEGRRRGSETWTRVSFNADQAKKAGVQNMAAYPEDMLVARATSRLARRIFADCLGGVPYLAEELEDVDGADAPNTTRGEQVDAVGEAPAPRRTVQRKPRPAVTATAVTPERVGSGTTAPQTDDEPPLDVAETLQEPHTAPETPKVDPSANLAQLRAIATICNTLGYPERPARLQLASQLIGRPITSGKDLTRQEAATLLDTLAMVQEAQDPQARLAEILATQERA